MAYNLEKITLDNQYYRQVIYTTKFQQLVLMSIEDGIEGEIHPDNDQFLRIEAGKARVTLGTEMYELEAGDSITVPAGTYHKVDNITGHSRVGIDPSWKVGQDLLKLYTIYSPPHHPPNTLERYRR